MSNNVTFENGIYGRRAVLNSSWATGMTEYLSRNGVVELVLNQAKGWRGCDLSFLSCLPNLKSFEIYDFNIKDITPIHSLTALRRLGVTTYCTTEIHFPLFPHLESCGLEWRPKAASLFECKALTSLFINCYSGKNVDLFSKLIKLESLAIVNAPIENLRGLGTLKKLRSLRLANLKRLTSLAGIEELSSLEELEVHTCRAIASIASIELLSRLKKLHLNNDGEIDSLKPLEKLTALESVLFYESTNIVDGDLSPLMRLKHLARVSFQNRRHYSHQREDFGIAYSK